MLAKATAEMFRPLVGEGFSVQPPTGSALELQLVQVEAAEEDATRAAEAAGLRLPFSIVFRGPRDPLLPQMTYTFRHAGLGTFDLFIVPIGQDEESTSYEAVFA